MHKLILILALVTIASAARSGMQPAYRFFPVTMTDTSIVLSTTTVPSVFQTRLTCYSTTAVAALQGITTCIRLARNLFAERPRVRFQNGTEVDFDDINPTKPAVVETTAAPAFNALEGKSDPVISLANVQSSTDNEANLDGISGRAAFGITIHYTTTSTFVLTSYSSTQTTYEGFVVFPCVPKDMAFTSCPPNLKA